MHWFAISDDLLMQEIDDDMIVLNLSTEEYFALNPTARRILDFCKKSASFEEAVERIVAEYEISVETARNDLTQFLKKLEHRSIARIHKKGLPPST